MFFYIRKELALIINKKKLLSIFPDGETADLNTRNFGKLLMKCLYASKNTVNERAKKSD